MNSIVKIGGGLLAVSVILVVAWSLILVNDGSSDEGISLVGTWRSELVNGYYIHEKVLNADSTYTGTWYVDSTNEVHSQVTGTWSATRSVLTTITDHIDTYDYYFVNSNTIEITIDNQDRTYSRV